MHSKAAFFTNHKPFFCTSPSLSLSKATLFHHKRRKFAPSHNLLFAKNTAILLSSALNPYAVTPEPRTDSKPFRRRFVRKTGFGSCRQKYLQKYFRQSFESQVAGRSRLPPHGRLAHVRSQFSLFRRSPTHKNLPLATFCTSERAFWLLFARRKK